VPSNPISRESLDAAKERQGFIGHLHRRGQDWLQVRAIKTEVQFEETFKREFPQPSISAIATATRDIPVNVAPDKAGDVERTAAAWRANIEHPPTQATPHPRATDDAMRDWMLDYQRSLKGTRKHHGRDIILSAARKRFEVPHKVVLAIWNARFSKASPGKPPTGSLSKGP
jgi:hypothetical protein